MTEALQIRASKMTDHRNGLASRADAAVRKLEKRKKACEKEEYDTKVYTKTVINLQKAIEEDIQYTHETIDRKTQNYLEKIEQLKMELTRTEAIKSIAEKKFEHYQKLYQSFIESSASEKESPKPVPEEVNKY